MHTFMEAPVIEMGPLGVMAYEKDRATEIGRPILVFMIDPICGCVIREALSTSRKPADALIEALRSWPPSKSEVGKLTVMAAGFGKELRATAVTRAARSAGYEIQHGCLPCSGTVERVFSNLTRWCEMRSRPGLKLNSKLTLVEMRQIVSISAAMYNQRKWSITDLNQATNAHKPPGSGIPLLVRSLYFRVQQSSLKHGFDTEQVSFIWRAASSVYSVQEISSTFEGILEKLSSTENYHDCLRVDPMSFYSAFNQPEVMLEGKGAVAIRTLAHLKVQRDQRAFLWFPGMDWNCSAISWVDFTYALLEKLVKDELVTDTLRCKLFARDLGL
ncbi:hypothetical protein [Pseudomonas brassicacearum]|uniref:hypothetical protein n=1 Tax=Pseudomonas brassicacearum TaxID=930166 RepID=UPI0039DF9544